MMLLMFWRWIRGAPTSLPAPRYVLRISTPREIALVRARHDASVSKSRTFEA